MRWIGVLLLISILAMAVSCGDSSEDSDVKQHSVISEEPDFGLEYDTPCDMTADRAGHNVSAAGIIAFIDDTPGDGRYADLEFEDCRVGIWVEKPMWESWTVSEQAVFSLDAIVLATGTLDLFSMPARPDEKQTVINLTSPLELLKAPDGSSPRVTDFKLEPLDGPACPFDVEDFWEEVQIQGRITLIDDSKAAGIYGEIESDGCLARIWVERTRWNTWTPEEQSLLSVGETVFLDGILTLVLREPVVDLSFPPALQ